LSNYRAILFAIKLPNLIILLIAATLREGKNWRIFLGRRSLFPTGDGGSTPVYPFEIWRNIMANCKYQIEN
jgi:hypothetical protein